MKRPIIAPVRPAAQWRWDVLALLAGLLIYFSIGLTNLRLPGLQYDEAADAVPAIEFMDGLAPSAIRNVTLFGRQWPLMMLHHIGPTSIYTSLIGLYLLGVSVEALRITQLSVGAIALVLLWKLARRWFGRAAAIVAVILCATAPIFVWWSRAGANWTVPLLPLSLGMLLALEGWWRRQNDAALIVAALLFGLGVTTKILFVWWIAPLALAAWLGFGTNRLAQALRRTSKSALAAAVVALFVGLLPLILHNVPDGDTVRFVLSNAAQTRIYGHNNLDVFNNLIRVWSEFLRALGGDTIHFNAPPGPPLGAVAFVAALGWTIATSVRARLTSRSAGYTARLLLVLTPLTVLPLSTVSTSSIGATYVFMIMPMAWLLIAVVVADLWQSTTNVQARAAIVAAVAALIASQLTTNIAVQGFFAATGGRGFWSDSIYALAEVLQARFPDRQVIAVDWGFRRPIEFLTRNKIRPREVFEYLPRPSPRFDDLSMALLREPHNLYLFHAPQVTAFGGHWERFERAALKSRMRLVQVAALHERDGVTNTLIYAAEPAPRTFDLPVLADPRGATLASGVELIGGEVRYDPAQREVSVMLYWRALSDGLPNDTVLLHIVNQANGEVVLVADTPPVYGAYPFSLWQRGEVVSDPHWVTLPEELPPSIYQVRVGAYDPQTGQRRAIADPRNDAAGDSLMLQTFEVK
ncbi:MAG: glycosyltransferase family 39 protein [Thermoflexales bacterium]|nr:glycosyltransferase family 39 protein [Thermoflexales bacterium]